MQKQLELLTQSYIATGGIKQWIMTIENNLSRFRILMHVTSWPSNLWALQQSEIQKSQWLIALSCRREKLTSVVERSAPTSKVRVQQMLYPLHCSGAVWLCLALGTTPGIHPKYALPNWPNNVMNCDSLNVTRTRKVQTTYRKRNMAKETHREHVYMAEKSS